MSHFLRGLTMNNRLKANDYQSCHGLVIFDSKVVTDTSISCSKSSTTAEGEYIFRSLSPS